MATMLGYARVSTSERELALQLDALESAGGSRVSPSRRAARWLIAPSSSACWIAGGGDSSWSGQAGRPGPGSREETAAFSTPGSSLPVPGAVPRQFGSWASGSASLRAAPPRHCPHDGGLMTGFTEAYDFGGRALVDRNGEKIGTVDEIYADREGEQPAWALVHTGLLGTSKHFVPLRGASPSGEDVRVMVDKQAVKDSPSVEADQELSEVEEQRLFEYYGVPYTTEGSTAPAQGRPCGLPVAASPAATTGLSGAMRPRAQSAATLLARRPTTR